MRSLNIGATGMMAQSTNVEVISHNNANMNTTAFKQQRAEFHDLIYQNMRRVGSPSSDASNVVPTGAQLGLGVKTAAIGNIMSQGNLTNTKNKLDVAIQGQGFFPITLPSGETGYTRDGTFSLDNAGQIITKDGYLVQPGITVPNDAVSITIAATGTVSAKIDGQVAATNLGTLQLATFINPSGLQRVGDNLYLETTASGNATTTNPGSTGVGSLQQGFLETSNVNIVKEITNLIEAQRAYEMNSKVISTSDKMMGTISNMR